MKIHDPVELLPSQVDSIDPACCSIFFHAEDHKQFWTVGLLGDRQASIVDEEGKLLKFDNKIEAEEFCHNNWPNLPIVVANS